MKLGAEDERAKELEAIPTKCPGTKRSYAKQLPRLIPTNCVGSAECVRVCPYEVLRMESGKPILAAPELCHECGLCVEACGFNALEMADIGSEPRTVKVPALNADYETGIGSDSTGLYIIGQAAGVAMVKNASNLGAWVIQHMIQVRGIRPGLALGKGLTMRY